MSKLSKALFSTLMMSAALTIGTAATPVIAEQTTSVRLSQAERKAVQNARLDFELTNSTGYPIVELYVGHISEDTWGENILNEDLEDGTSTTVYFDPDEEGVYWDMKAVFVDGDTIEYRELDLAEISRVTLHYDYDGETGVGRAEFE